MHSVKQITLIIKKLKASLPGDRIPLICRTPFELLIATMLSAQSTDITANRVADRIFFKYKDARGFAAAKPALLEKDIYSAGFYKVKSRNIISASRQIITRFKGRVPRTMAGLLQLPGVGRKTANIVLSGAFKRPEGIAVDTHVKRITRRLGITRNTDPERIEKDLLNIIPRRYWLVLNHIFVNLGRNVCKSRKPLCSICVIERYCFYENKNL
jgi:endonuclease III